MSAGISLAAIAVELLALWAAQRRIWARLDAMVGSRAFAYLLVMPGTVLHESCHLVMCLCLGVRPRRGTRLFWPTPNEDGSVTFGQVRHKAVGPVRRTLISIAPLLLGPLAILGAERLLLGPGLFEEPWDALTGAPFASAVAAIAIPLLAANACFPSPGDKVGVRGAFVLVFVVAIALSIAVDSVGLEPTLEAVALVLAAPGIAGAALLVLMPRGMETRTL